MPKKTPVKDTEAYIQLAAPAAQPVLAQLAKLLRKAQPTEETIKWGQPFFLFKVKRASIAAYKSHVSVSFSTDLTTEQSEKAQELGYSTGQKRINIGFEQAIPETLIHTILTDE
ncbi:DUF1801 domain-containing protein [Enterococcus sp. 669A]|uniref:DUF1801 domain-containing protein n=1 Tax=Candidatus Enterococcus moelleringii TaxID=2815325 RepID=A0ABS3L960_9ENTE|nr:DUF1801 domain-containing protein [Enterococcus sp. 669A]MBO1306179.1 DUF1801 domain-containing protein [Enterococcus sp. 669A]